MGYSPSTRAISTVWFGAIVSILLILVGELGSVETLAYIGIWGCVVGLVMVLYGLRFADGGDRLEARDKGKKVGA